MVQNYKIAYGNENKQLFFYQMQNLFLPNAKSC